MKVLIADADASVRETVRDALGEFGYRCLTAATARDARHAIQAERPKILLISTSVDGLAIADVRALLVQEGQALACYVVALVASLDGDGLRDAMLAGADDFLVCPLHRSSFTRDSRWPSASRCFTVTCPTADPA